MNNFIILLLAGLAVCGCLIRRHHHRTAGDIPSVVSRPADDPRAADASGQNLKSASPGNLDWREKLRLEEAKQRPWEGRN